MVNRFPSCSMSSSSDAMAVQVQSKKKYSILLQADPSSRFSKRRLQLLYFLAFVNRINQAQWEMCFSREF
jgi:hypothetical protein